MMRYFVWGLPLVLVGLGASGPVHTAVRASSNDLGNSRNLAAVSPVESFSTVAQAAATPTGDGTVYYVATSGSDENPGTRERPFRSINRGVRVLTPADTLVIRGGTYAEEIKAGAIPGGTSWSSPVTLAAFPGESVTIRPQSGASRVMRFAGSSQKYIIIKGPGLILDAINVTNDGVKITGDSSGSAHHIRFQDVEVRNANGRTSSPGSGVGNGISVIEGSDDNEFIRVNSHHNGKDRHDHGIYLRSHRNLVDGGQFWRNMGSGIQVRSATISPTANIIRNVKAYDNSQDPLESHSAGIQLADNTRGTLVYNNLVYRNAAGIRVDWGSSGAKLYHNTIHGCRGFEGIRIAPGGTATNSLVRNNIVYKCGIGIEDNGTGTVKSNNLLVVNPVFANEAGLDFRLNAGSPAIDAGVTLSEVTADFDLRTRPRGAASDIGAYEF